MAPVDHVRRDQLVVVQDGDAVAREAARRLFALASDNAGVIRFCLSGGGTPQKLFGLLATPEYRASLPWDRVHWYWGDDRFVPPQDARSNSGVARAILLDKSFVPKANVHPIATQDRSLDAAARDYAQLLQQAYGSSVLDPQRPLFDALLMGVGEDGHTASLFPGHAAVEEDKLWVVGEPNAAQEPHLPRVTLTLPALASCRQMIFVVSGSAKRPILARVLSGENLPAGRAFSQGELVCIADAAAAPPS